MGWRPPRSLPGRLLLGVIGLSVGLLGVSLFLAFKDRGSEVSSGAFGQVMMTACDPVQQTGDLSPCPPYSGEIRVLRRDESLVMIVRTDQAGRYRVALPPGRYIIDSNDGGKSIANREGFVLVREGEFSRVNLTHYVGIVCLLGQTWMHLADAPRTGE